MNDLSEYILTNNDNNGLDYISHIVGICHCIRGKIYLFVQILEYNEDSYLNQYSQRIPLGIYDKDLYSWNIPNHNCGTYLCHCSSKCILADNFLVYVGVSVLFDHHIL